MIFITHQFRDIVYTSSCGAAPLTSFISLFLYFLPSFFALFHSENEQMFTESILCVLCTHECNKMLL